MELYEGILRAHFQFFFNQVEESLNNLFIKKKIHKFIPNSIVINFFIFI